VRSKKKKYRPNLSLNLPDSMMLDIRTEKQVKIQSGPDVHVVPATPATPMTPAEFTPDFLPQARMHRSVSVPAEAHAVGRGKDELWRVVKNSNRQFLSTKPKADRKISYCVNGKIKFSLKYDLLGQKELLVEISEFIDLPLARESGVSNPYIKVCLYPQEAHAFGGPEEIKDKTRVEVLTFPRESSCSFVGVPSNKLQNLAIMFTILDYDRFSRSEFQAECVVMLDEVSLEGELVTKHLSITKTDQDKDIGSLLVSVCYQPTGNRMAIVVMKANDLPETDGGHSHDHFVKITLLRDDLILDKRRTRVVKKTSSPIFNDRFMFPVDQHGVRNLVFLFEVIRYDSKLKQEKIGNVLMGNNSQLRQVSPQEIQHFNDMIVSPQRQIAEWHKLFPPL